MPLPFGFAASGNQDLRSIWSWRPRQRLILFSLFAFTSFLILSKGWILAPERADPAMWDYMAQAIVRGQVPYRDVVNIKTPLSAYISALGILIGRACGFNELMAIRYVGVVLAALLVVITYLITEKLTRNRAIAFASALLPLIFEQFCRWSSAGTEPKLSMTMFGALSLLLVLKNKPFWAGIAAGLSFWCWQPGLLFAGAAFLVLSGYLTRWRDRRAARMAAGAVIPFAAITAYFYWAGALEDFWKWCIVFDATVYAPNAFRGASDQIRHIGLVAARSFGAVGVVLVILAAVGYLAAVVQTLRRRDVLAGLPNEPRTAPVVLIAATVYPIYLRFDTNSTPYFIPLVPFASIYLGVLITLALSWVRSRSREQTVGLRHARVVEALLVIILAALAVTISTRTRYSGPTIRDEYRLLEPMRAAMNPDDKIWAHGEINILVLLDRPSVSKYLWFDRLKDDFVASTVPGGFEQVLRSIDSEQPRFVEMGRGEAVQHIDEIKDWLNANYSRFPILGFEVYVRGANGTADPGKTAGL